jgi:RNA polymerase subunit RPABC4/transcription elongation factor Spt4
LIANEAGMTLVRCPSCRNMVARESGACPVCGVNYRTAAIRHFVKWAVIAVVVLWLVGRYIFKI